MIYTICSLRKIINDSVFKLACLVLILDLFDYFDGQIAGFHIIICMVNHGYISLSHALHTIKLGKRNHDVGTRHDYTEIIFLYATR